MPTPCSALALHYLSVARHSHLVVGFFQLSSKQGKAKTEVPTLLYRFPSPTLEYYAQDPALQVKYIEVYTYHSHDPPESGLGIHTTRGGEVSIGSSSRRR